MKLVLGKSSVMKDNFFDKLIHRTFVPSEANSHRPYVLRKRAFMAYGLFVLFTFVMLTPMRDVHFRHFLASITEGLVIAQVNPDREQLGLLPLEPHEKLTQAAQLKAEDMIGRGYFSHEGPSGEKPWVWLERVGYRYATAGENLAVDFSDPTVLVNAWLASPSHARNIRKGYFTDVGVGVAHGALLGRNTTVVVMFLGREITPTLEAVLAVSKATTPETSETSTTGAVEPENIGGTLREEESGQTQDEGRREGAVTASEQEGSSAHLASPDASLEDFAPETPVSVAVVEKEMLDKEIEAILKANQGATLKGPVPQVASAQSFAVSRAPHIVRLVLTILFSVLVAQTLIIVFFQRGRYLFFTSRILTLSVFMAFLWLPELFV